MQYSRSIPVSGEWREILLWISWLCFCSYSPGCCWPLCCQHLCAPVLGFSPIGPNLHSNSFLFESFVPPQPHFCPSSSNCSVHCSLCAVYLCPAISLQASFPLTSLTKYTLLFPSASAWATWTRLEVSHCKRHGPVDTKESLTQKSQWLQGSSCSASQQHTLHRWNRWETEMINLFLLSMHKAMSSKL